jgi:hypothetical protein
MKTRTSPHGTNLPAHAGSLPSDELRDSAKRGLWQLQLFLLISCGAFLVRDFNLYTTFPESVLQVLGCPPPPVLVYLALAGYLVTAMIPLTIHLLTGEAPTAQWRHLGYRTAFYLFFLWSGTLTAHFALVFIAGVALYLLEQLGIGLASSRTSQRSGQPA